MYTKILFMPAMQKNMPLCGHTAMKFIDIRGHLDECEGSSVNLTDLKMHTLFRARFVMIHRVIFKCIINYCQINH